MEKMRMESVDLISKNIERIQELFPNCVTETVDEAGHAKKVINFEFLRQMLSDDVLDGDEAYEFTWVGKKAAIVEANKPIRKTLRPCPEESVDWDTTENLYIEGDNLEVLKLLQESYLGKIDLIYIDPPYNTGNDFIYLDDFSLTKDEYSEASGEYDGDNNRLFKNNDTNGRFHSDWCSMIYSRLFLARNLLSKDGVIAISISYNELHNLMKICQELFNGRQVFAVTVQTSGGKPNGAFSISCEYVVFVVPEDYVPIPTEEDMKEYASAYHGMNLATFNQVQRPNQTYPIYVNPEGIIVGCGKSLQERMDLGLYTGDPADFVFDYDEAPVGATAIWPVTAKGDQCVWRLIPERLLGDWAKGYIKVVPQKGGSNRNGFTVQYLSGGIIGKILSGELETYAFADRLIRNKNVPFSKMQYAAVCVMFVYSFVNMAVVVKMSKGAVDYLVVFDLTCLVLVDLFLLYAMKIMNEKEFLEYEIGALEQQAKMQYEYYLRQEQKYNATVRVLHDVDKHTRAMEQLYSAGNAQAAMEYGGQISGMLKPLIPVRYTGNPILDILLSDKAEVLREKEIRFETKVDNVALDFVEPIDITTIFGNLLDNAVEACMEVGQDKHISIKISSYHQMVSVRIENSCNPVRWKNGQPVSEKGKGRGIGLLNVRRSIEKYDGSMKLKYEDGMFIVELFLNS